jgi:2-phospho-L-lactate guanylyltransferase
VIPVKGTPSSKSRLGATPELALAIALDTVAAALEAASAIVVTSALAAPSFEAIGARAVVDAGGGLGASIAQGIAAVETGAVAVLLGDLPALRGSELAAALAVAEGHALAFVADADDEGTALITALAASAHAPAFGAGSRAAHLAAGYIELDVPRDSGLRRDVDTPDQLAALAPRVGAHTRALLLPHSP